MPPLLTFKQVGELLSKDASTVRKKEGGTATLTHINLSDPDAKRAEYRIPRDEVEQLVLERFRAARAPFDHALAQVFDFQEIHSRRRQY